MFLVVIHPVWTVRMPRTVCASVVRGYVVENDPFKASVSREACLRSGLSLFGAKAIFCPEAQSDSVGLKQAHNDPG